MGGWEKPSVSISCAICPGDMRPADVRTRTVELAAARKEMRGHLKKLGLALK